VAKEGSKETGGDLRLWILGVVLGVLSRKAGSIDGVERPNEILIISQDLRRKAR
jgi:hypothetical protein